MIEVKKLKHSYNKDNGEKIDTLKGVDFTIKKGEFISVIGHNGSGKSTLAKHLNGLIIPIEGEVVVDGIKVEDDDEIWEIRRKVGMVFQNPDNQFVGSTVLEDMAFGLENIGFESQLMEERINESASMVGVKELLLRPPHKLSGGQKQRSAIGSVLAMKPDYIVLDEPTAMLDPKGRREVLKCLEKLNKEEGKTIILITHFLDEIITSDQVFVLNKGEIVLKGSPLEIFNEEEVLLEIGMELPKIKRLAMLLNKKDNRIDKNILIKEELVGAICGLK